MGNCEMRLPVIGCGAGQFADRRRHPGHGTNCYFRIALNRRFEAGQAWTAEKVLLTYALVRFVSTDPEGIKDRSRWSRSAPPVTRLKT